MKAMANGWTGAQYSVVRVVLGLSLATRFSFLLAEHGWSVVVAIGLVASLVFALGYRDRVAAVVAAPPAMLFEPILGALLLVHALFVRGAPYGAWDARGRLDPGGGWSLPARALIGFRLIAILAVLWGIAAWRHGDLDAPERGDVVVVVCLATLFACDPRWVRAREEATPALVLYDGECGFCQGWVRFLVAEDVPGTRFRFAPLQGERAREALTDEQRRAMGETVVVLTPDARILSRSDAAADIGARLGGLWRVAALLMRALPRFLRDGAYDAVARLRHRLAARPKEACPILPPPLRARFEV